MNDREAFLAAIIASPFDNATRLIFADWLDEQNNDDDSYQAAFIRGQIAGTIQPVGGFIGLSGSNEVIPVGCLQHHNAQVGGLNEVIHVMYRDGFIGDIYISHQSYLQCEEIIKNKYPIRNWNIIDPFGKRFPFW